MVYGLDPKLTNVAPGGSNLLLVSQGVLWPLCEIFAPLLLFTYKSNLCQSNEVAITFYNFDLDFS